MNPPDDYSSRTTALRASLSLDRAEPARRALSANVQDLAAPLLLAALSLFLFTFHIGAGTLWDQDEAKYTEVARQILERRDPITLYVNNSPWFVHPPLYMWLQAATGALIGWSEFSARIWTAVFGSAGVVLTYLLGRRLFNAATGIIAAVMLATMLEYFMLSRLAIFDVVLSTFMLLVLYEVLAAESATPDPQGGAPDTPALRGRRVRAYRWAAVWAGLATLTKGPIGLILPGLIIATWWALRGVSKVRWREVIRWDTVVLYAAIGLSWYGLETIRHGATFVRTVVGYYMLTRFFGVVENQPGPWFYYLPVLALGAFPWSAFLAPALVFHGRRLWDHPHNLLIVLWIAITLLFYSLAGTKLPNYILPSYPLAAIAVASLWVAGLGVRSEQSESGQLIGWGFRFVVFFGVLVGVAVVIFGRTKYPAELGALAAHLRWLGVGLVLGLTAAGVLHSLKRPLAGFGALVVTMIALFTVMVTQTLPRAEALKPMPDVALRIRERIGPDDVIVGVNTSEYASLIYYAQHPVRWTWGLGDTTRTVCGERGAFVVARSQDYEGWIRRLFSEELVPIYQKGNIVLLHKVKRIPCAQTGPSHQVR